jgi:phage tail-like protein
MATDPLHAFRFHVKCGAVVGVADDPMQPESRQGVGIESEAGFQAVTAPELSVEPTEYREGIKTYTHKYPGIPTTNTLTFSRGVARFDTAFYLWVIAAAEGREYRTDLSIFHALREGRTFPFDAANNFSMGNSKVYICREAFPTRVKIAGDLDASTSDVSLAEVDCEFEKPDVYTPPGVAATLP